MKRHLGILFVSLTFVIVSSISAMANSNKPVGKPAPQERCQPKGTPKDDVIVCTGTDTDGVEAGRGDDLIVIESGATVRTTASDPQPQSTAVDGQADNDTIINHGQIHVNVLSIGNTLKNIPALGTDKEVAADRAVEDKKMAKGTGIAGGDGADTIENIGKINVNTITNTSASDSSGGSQGPDAKTRSSQALSLSTGIDGGADHDVIVNRGDITVTATSIADKADLSEGNTTAPGNSADNKDVKAVATAVGIHGGGGDDAITNTASITAIATSAPLILNSGGSNDAANSSPQTKSGTTVQATATGIDGGDGNDNITNEQTVSAIATTIAPSVGVELGTKGGLNVDATVTPKSQSTGIDGGDGNDNILNKGTVTSLATSTAFAVSGSVSKQGNSLVPKAASDSSTSAEASATGIAGGSGNDNIRNEGVVDAIAIAESLSASGSLAVEGNSAAKSTSTAKSSATGIDAGAGDDTVASSGSVAAIATSLAQGLSIGVTVKESSNPPASANADKKDFKAAADSSTTAEATAAGIVGDSGETVSTSSTEFSGLSLTYSTSKQAVSGNDSITNDDVIAAAATAVSTAGSGALTIEGEASAKATSTAKTTAIAIDAGGGNDVVSNSGVLGAAATSIATGLSVGVSLKSDSTDGTQTQATQGGSKAVADTSVTAEATAAGIIGDSGEQSSSTELGLAITSSGLTLNYRTSKEAASGEDTITNSGAIGVLANAASAAGAGAVTLKGDASAKATSTAKSRATGIDAGSGDDTVNSSGTIVAEAGAVAAGLSVGVSAGSGDSSGGSTSPVQPIVDLFSGPKAAAEASVTAEATAAGILGDSGEGTSGKETSLGIQVDLNNNTGGISLSHSESTAGATGDDTITSSAGITALANALSGAAGGAVALEGDASAKATSTAKSTATGIDAGAGDDGVTNSGEILAEAGSIAAGLSIAVGVDTGQSGGTGGDNPLQPILDLFAGPKAAAEASVTAEATAAGILGDSGAGATSQETSLGIQVDLANNTGGISHNHAESTAGATGDDTITNSAGLTVLANSLSGAVGGAVAIGGDASVKATSTAKSTATGIDAGSGKDTIDSSGSILAEAGSVAAGLSIAVGVDSGQSGGTGGGNPLEPILDLFAGPKATAEVSVIAETTAAGILGDSGEGTTSKETSLGLEVDLANNTGGISYNHAESTAGATGDDTITNSAGLTVLANSLSGAVGGAVALEGDASAKATSTAKSTATGIDAGAGDDAVDNSGSIFAEAGAVAAALNVGVSLGSGGSSGGSTSTTQSIIDLFSPGAKAAAETSVAAEATAAGIIGDGGEGTSSKQTTLGIQVDLNNNTGGISLSHSESTAGATGDDTITSSANITALANTLSGAAGGAVALEGDASAKATSTAKSTAMGVDAGAGDDAVDNSGSIFAEAGAVAAGLSVGVGLGSGQSGGTSVPTSPSKTTAEASVTAEATAAGIIGDSGEGTSSKETSLGIQVDLNNNTGGISLSHSESTAGATGDDTITSSGNITALANSLSGAAGGAVTLEGDASAKATSTAKSTATGIDAGAGNDTVDSSGSIFAEAGAVAAGLSVGVGVGSGNTSGSKATTEASVTAEATAAGILGDSGQANTVTEVDLSINLDALNFTFSASKEAASGNDRIVNDGRIDVVAGAVSGAGAVAIGLEGKASVKSMSEATSTATGIGGGGGDDSITNRGGMTATAVSAAGALSVAITTKGGARATGGIWHGGADAQATALGIAGDSAETNSSTQITINADFEDLSAQFGYQKKEESVTGSDTIRNEGSITATAIAEAPAVNVAVAATEGIAAAISNASAEARSSAIDAGGGNDQVFNSGELTSTAVANANAISVSVAGKGTALAGDAVWSGGATSKATAKGIDGDGDGSNKTTEITASVGTDGVNVAFRRAEDGATGDDTINNEGDVTATAVAATPAISVAVGVQGMAGAVSTSEAKSLATAIDAGDGNDAIQNSGELTANATSVAVAVNVAVSPKSGAVAADAIWEGGVTAEATAKGIDTDGSARNNFTGTTLVVSQDGVAVGHRTSADIASGNDTITNETKIGATATAVAPAVSGAVSAQGVGIASSTATAKAVATAIDAGSGSDDITNRGDLAATAVANADAVNVAVITGAGLSLAGNPVWDGGTTSEAVAKGIDGDGTGTSSASDTTLTIRAGEAVFAHRNSETGASGDDRITNMNKVDATATAVSAGLTVGVAVSGVSGAISTSTAKSEATAIDAGAGDDEIHNSGELAATATSVAASVNVAVSAGTGVAIAADAVFDGGTTAQATAKGIDADGKSTNKTTDTTVTANSDGTTVDHSATASIAQGQDIIVNEGKVDAIATAVAPSVGVAVAVSGAGVAASTATAQAQATAIDAGAGNDSITNRGELTATAVATAEAVNVSVTPAGVAVAADAVWSGGTTAEAIAKGIDADGSGIDSESQTTLVVHSDGPSIRHFQSVQAATGNDAIANEARIDATAVAVAPSISVSVAVSGVGVSASTATARAEAMAIDGGGGDDSIANRGELDATATSVAAAVNVSVTGAGLAVATDAIWSGGTTAEAVATGIHADGNTVSTQTETTLAFTSGDPSFNHQSEIRPAMGNDTITNEAKIDTTATAVSGSIGVSVAVAGVAAAASTATARADATAINAGGGDDSITNTGDLASTAVANANAVVVSVTPAGVAVAADAVWDGGTTAEASATGISADGKVEAAQTQTTISAHGIRNKTIVESVSGNDNILNEAKIDATAVAVSPAVDVAVAVAGVAAAVANSTAKADATAIDAGGGSDSITNRGDLTATSVANADTLNVSVSVTGVGAAGNAVWDGGTTVEATATGIHADGKGSRITTERNINLSSDGITIVKRTTQESDSGNDVIVNEGKVVARATAVPVSVAVGVAAVGGVGAAFSTSTAKSSAAAINAGGGGDMITNRGELQAGATSTAVTVNATFSLIGAGISADAVWDGGTTAEATAVGIDADGQGSRVTTERTITVNAAGVDSDTQTTTESASGNDIIINEGKITAKADANSPSVAVGLGGILGAAISTSTAESQATAIAAGAGDDEVHNSGELEATAESTAVAVNASVSVGAALSVNNFWDGGTTATATAKGIEGGAGNDTVTNAARIEAVATAKSPSVSVALGGIVGAAISTATARADATAIDAGAGDDQVNNTGELHARADSSATTVNVSASGWAALSWDGGTTATATAKGINGGAGKDTVTNAGRIEADATAKSPSVSVALGGVVGAAISTATATANATAIDAGDDDDTIVNHGLLIADSEADANAVNVAVNFGLGLALAGDAMWEGGTTAEAISKGIDTGTGSDTLTNHGLINATSTANTTSTGVAVVLGGVSAALAGSTATARSTALDGGDGDDTIANHGALTAHATADARGTSVSVALVGAAAADTSSNAIAQATGIDGGQGNDSISNSAPLSVMALATAKGSSVEVAVVGATVANPLLESGTNADATAIGLTGSAGSDTVANFSTINLESTARTDSTTVSVSLVDFGGGSANVSADAKARGTGIEGGAGSNILDNQGVITAAVTAESPVRGVNVSLAGVAQADFSTNADAGAYGISGGEDDDEITNSGVIALTATARAPATGTSVNIAGVTEQSVSATATASATGADGGEGDDAITNSGMLIATALSEATVSGSSWTLAGRSAQQGISTAVGQATGISGGGGADVIVNQGSIVVSGTTTLRTEGNSSALFGGTAADASVNGNVAATGIDGGGDEDQISNTGVIEVTATSNSSAVGSAFTLAGSARGKSGTTATATAIGIAGGLADDLIVNSGVLTAQAATNATASNSAWTLAGGAGGDAALEAASKSTGIAGGAGADGIDNDGAVTADASATLNVNGGAQAIFGGAGSGSAVNANVMAIGVDGGDGENWIENTSTIAVTGTARMISSTASFSLTGSPSAAAFLTATSQATGISGGNDADWIHNLGNVSVVAQSQQTATGGSSSTVAGGAASSTASRASASAAGVDGGMGDDIVVNDGTIAVDANPTGTARNVAAGGFLFGMAGARSDLNLDSTSHGVVLGDGDNVLSNTGEIAVKARGDGLADAKADGGRLVNGSAFATARVSGGGLAHGVKAGDGDNWIYNEGSLNVVVEPRLRADNADANGNGITNANGTALATASTTGKAIGIEAGHGDNRITNNGALSVIARPEATAVAVADSDLIATARATATATATAEGTGIRTGNGNNRIVNNGTISVLAAPTANATAQATADKISVSICIPFTRICKEIIDIGGQAIATSQSTESATAIGIETGSGDDTIINNGTIAATEVQNDVSSRGVAISSGAGNDTVMLGDGSLTTGHIELGFGNDTFHLIGTPTVNGNISSGSGTNSLIFEGTGSFANPLVGFVNTLKQGAGTYTLPSLSTMQRLEIKEGTLQLNSSYTMGSGSTFQTIVNGDGTHGRLKVGGTAGLDGALVVDKGPGAYSDGATYDIVSASTVSGSFASEALPDPTALVSFSTNQLPAAFQVEASVASFTSVTNNSVGFAVASALDTILPNATGDMSRVLGSLQQLTQSDFNKIYAGISGESYDHFRASTFNAMRRYSGVMHSRMNQMRAAFRGMSILEGADRTQMSQDALLTQYGPVSGVLDLPHNSSASQLLPRYGMWLSTFGQAAGQKGSDGYSGFNSLTTGVPFGFDFPLSNNLIAGFAAGQSVSDIIRDQAVGRTEGAFSAMYATYFTRNAHVEAVLSRGWNLYENRRVMDLGNEKRVAASRHGGDAYSAALEARYRFDFDALTLEPFSSLHYSRLVEDGFRETGAGSLNLIVNKRETESLSSQLGFRVVSSFSLESGKFVPEFTAAWKHDFTADRRSITGLSQVRRILPLRSKERKWEEKDLSWARR